MGTLTIKQRFLNKTAEYTDSEAGIKMNIECRLNDETGELITINGNVYLTENNAYAGNFSGQMQNGEMIYSLSNVKLKDVPAIMAAVADVKNQIMPSAEQDS